MQFWSNCVQLLFYPSSVFVPFLLCGLWLVRSHSERFFKLDLRKEKKKILTLKISAALEKNLVGRLVQSCVLECFCLSKSMVVPVSKWGFYVILFIFSTSSAALVAVSGVRVTDAAQLPAVRAVVSLRISGWKSRDRSLAEHQAAFSSAWLCRLRGRNEAADVSPPRPT